MNYYKDNCRHFRYIYKDERGIDGGVDRMKVGGKCLIDKIMVYRECSKSCKWFEPK